MIMIKAEKIQIFRTTGIFRSSDKMLVVDVLSFEKLLIISWEKRFRGFSSVFIFLMFYRVYLNDPFSNP